MPSNKEYCILIKIRKKKIKGAAVAQ